MEREIKFRVWDNLNGKFIYSDWKYGIVSFWEEIMQDYLNQYKPLQQYTGLKDKNDKEIYEGDIVRRGHVVKEVKWVTVYCQCGFNVGTGYNYPKPKTDTRIEVIGNKFENPELLK